MYGPRSDPWSPHHRFSVSNVRLPSDRSYWCFTLRSVPAHDPWRRPTPLALGPVRHHPPVHPPTVRPLEPYSRTPDDLLPSLTVSAPTTFNGNVYTLYPYLFPHRHPVQIPGPPVRASPTSWLPTPDPVTARPQGRSPRHTTRSTRQVDRRAPPASTPTPDR